MQDIHLPLADWLLIHTSDLGFPPLSPLTIVAVFVLLFAMRLRLEALLAVLSTLLLGLVGSAIKLVIHRARPTTAFVHVTGNLRDFGFPSGHVLTYTLLFGFALYAVAVGWRPGWIRSLLLGLFAFLIALVGPSRMYLGQHWPSDVLAAYSLAALWLAGTIKLHLF